MSIFIFISLSAFILFLFFLLGFIWSVKTDQYEDLDLPAIKILWEDLKKK